MVAAALARAAKSGKEFRVFLTRSGERSKKWFDVAGIPSTLIEDMTIGYIMNKVTSPRGCRAFGKYILLLG